MNYSKPIIPVITNPVGLDAAIQSLQLELSTLEWLSHCFGRAWEHKEQDDLGQLVRVPKCFMGIDAETKKAEYINVLPNDSLENFTAMSFFAVRDREFWVEESFNPVGQNAKERLIAVIFWGDLIKIDDTKNYIYTEELKNDVERILKGNQYVKNIIQYYDERVENVFDGLINEAKYARYTVNDIKNPYLMHPFFGFRFDLTLGYYEQC
jgi:hypothetical protein